MPFYDNLKELLLAEHGSINCASLKSMYRHRFGVDIKLRDGQKLKDLLERAERKGVCALENRIMPNGPPVLFVHTVARGALSVVPPARPATGAAPRGFTLHVQEEKTRKPILFQANVDTSGSMSGGRALAAADGLSGIFRMMQPTDLFGLSTFDTNSRNLHRPMRKDTVDWQKDHEHIRANASSGGRTALYDAIGDGVKQCQEMRGRRNVGHDTVFFHLVITDGQDNASSSFSLADAMREVAHPELRNYNFVLIAVGMTDATTRALCEMCAPEHATFLRAADVSELKAQLDRCQKDMLKMTLAVQRADGRRSVVTASADSRNVPGAAAMFDAAESGALLQQMRSLTVGHGTAALSPPTPPRAAIKGAPTRRQTTARWRSLGDALEQVQLEQRIDVTANLHGAQRARPMPFAMGDKVTYNGNVGATVIEVHRDLDPPYYTIRTDDGRVKQTEAEKLTRR